ncbi:MAG: hypothetical protein LBL91_05170 [Lachnospiraceae bacterium]|nr:hypothetical protein [Lachnospiraceae bacterium]
METTSAIQIPPKVAKYLEDHGIPVDEITSVVPGKFVKDGDSKCTIEYNCETKTYGTIYVELENCMAAEVDEFFSEIFEL